MVQEFVATIPFSDIPGIITGEKANAEYFVPKLAEFIPRFFQRKGIDTIASSLGINSTGWLYSTLRNMLETDLGKQNLNKFLNSLFNVDSVKVKQLISMYTDFADRFPNDTSASKYLFSASRLYVSLENYKQSITLLDKIINNYPKTKIAPDCMFMKAYIYDDKIKDYKSALKFYNEFINKYPTHDLVSAAKASIGSLGVPAEVVIKGFENTKAIKVDTIR